jgi:putative transcriptional regulator
VPGVRLIAVFLVAWLPAPVTTQLQPGTVRALARGKILVASRELRDPNFAQSVVLLLDHSPRGSMGVIINRRSDVPLSGLLDMPKSPATPPTVFLGGPVDSSGVLALLRADAGRADSKRLIDGVFEVTTPQALRDLVSGGAGSDRLRVYYGYAGWSADQLERETRAGAWQVFDGTAAIVFDPEPDTLWQREIPHAGELTASLY